MSELVDLAERHETETALARLDLQQQESTVLDLEATSGVLDLLPDLSTPLANADPELRRRVYEAFQFGIELDRNTPQVRLKALVSSAFSTAKNLDDLAVMVADKPIAGGRYGPAPRPLGVIGGLRGCAAAQQDRCANRATPTAPSSADRWGRDRQSSPPRGAHGTTSTSQGASA